MTTKKKILYLILSSLGLILIISFFLIYLSFKTSDSTTISGEKIDINLNEIHIDQYLNIPGGKIGISNTKKKEIK